MCWKKIAKNFYNEFCHLVYMYKINEIHVDINFIFITVWVKTQEFFKIFAYLNFKQHLYKGKKLKQKYIQATHQLIELFKFVLCVENSIKFKKIGIKNYLILLVTWHMNNFIEV